MFTCCWLGPARTISGRMCSAETGAVTRVSSARCSQAAKQPAPSTRPRLCASYQHGDATLARSYTGNITLGAIMIVIHKEKRLEK